MKTDLPKVRKIHEDKITPRIQKIIDVEGEGNGN
jgi:hypothetical protein